MNHPTTIRLAVAAMLVIAAAGSASSASAQALCAADCRAPDLSVTVDELVSCVNVTLGRSALGVCTSCDANEDDTVQVNEIVAGVGNLLTECVERPRRRVPVDAVKGITKIVEDTIQLLDFGYVGNVTGSAGHAQGTADFDPCFCPNGGEVLDPTCAFDGTWSTFSGTLVDCIAADVTRQGSLALRVKDPNFCNTCIIPVSVEAVQTFEDGFVAAAAGVAAFTVQDELVETFTLKAAGRCLRPGSLLANDRDSTLSGSLRVGPAAGPNAVATYDDFRSQIATTVDNRGFCRITSIQDGRVSVDDQINNRQFTQIADNLVITDTLINGGPAREVTLDTPDGGSVNIDCLGGPTQLITRQPLLHPQVGACPTSGQLETRPLNSALSTCATHTAAGGVEFDFLCNGTTDQTLSTCRASSDDRCAPPPNVPTPTPTATFTPLPTATRTASQVPTSSFTQSPTPTLSPVSAPTPTVTSTLTPNPTHTPTVTPTAADTPTSRPTIVGCTTLVAGQIEGETWTAAGSPYCVDGDVLVKGSGLVIQPGVRVEFHGDHVFEVQGTLQATGTENAQIVFTKGAGFADTVGRGIFFNNAPAGSVLKHCRIDSLNDSGLYIANSYPTIENCSITNNKVTGNGGGVRLFLASPGNLLMKNSHIDSNLATGHGGGIYASLSAGSLTLDNSTVNNNRANSNYVGGNYYGGGIYAQASGGLTLERSEIKGNYTYSSCSGTYCGSYAYGGGLYLDDGFADLEASTVSSNTAEAGCGGFGCVSYAYGGGVYGLSGAVDLENSVVSHNATRGTYKEGSGTFSSNAAVSLLNSTVAYNSDDGLHNSAGVLQVRNTIVYANSGTQIQGAATVNYSDIQGGWVTGEGNIDQPPEFVSLSDLRLDCAFSPCVDAGDRFDDACLPPACGTARNDIGAFGGRGNCAWDEFQ